MTEILDRISTLLVARFGVEADEFQPDVTLADLDLDSLALVEFGLVAEKEFGVKIGDNEVSPSDTVGDLAKLIIAKGAVG